MVWNKNTLVALKKAGSMVRYTYIYIYIYILYTTCIYVCANAQMTEVLIENNEKLLWYSDVENPRC